MKPLIDGDILAYEVGWSSQYLIDEEGDKTLPSSYFIQDADTLVEWLENKIGDICFQVDATEPPVIYLTADKNLMKYSVRSGEEWKPNFRIEVAEAKGYKANRKDVMKPFNYHNIRALLYHMYDCKVANGLEADDLMAIDAYKDLDNTIICSRDKDLKTLYGNHYGWECHLQPEEGPFTVEGIGSIYMEERKNEQTGKISKLFKGNGPKLFYAQAIIGDTVDNIPGLPKRGPAYAIKVLDACTTERECYEAVKKAYQETLGEDSLDYMKEQMYLLHIVRELDGEGNPILFKPPRKE